MGRRRGAVVDVEGHRDLRIWMWCSEVEALDFARRVLRTRRSSKRQDIAAIDTDLEGVAGWDRRLTDRVLITGHQFRLEFEDPVCIVQSAYSP